MGDLTRNAIRGLFFVGLLSMGWLAIESEMNAWAEAPPTFKSSKPGSDADRGRAVFNGKGVCHYCHGIDGNKDQWPELATDTAALIARLNPPPADLRNPKALSLKNDKQRAQAIREGHPGTGMFPDTTMTDQELSDTLAYLALLRSEGSANRK